jgi:F0F1-type ATP synthase membrane subunit c/vacuolar-type H+-ATPase subunit K
VRFHRPTPRFADVPMNPRNPPSRTQYLIGEVILGATVLIALACVLALVYGSLR